MTLQLLQPFDLADQATITWNPSAYPIARVTLGGNRAFSAPVPLEPGATYMLFVVQDSTGSRLITWDSVFKWNTGAAPTLTTTGGATDIMAFVSDGTYLYGVPQYDFS